MTNLYSKYHMWIIVKKSAFIMLLCILPLAFNACNQSIQYTEEDALALFEVSPKTQTTTPYNPTQHPEAQWFPDAKFGLFIHWGIYATKSLRPSWGILHNRFGKKFPRDISVEDYYELAKEFNPQHYDPDQWMKMAKSLGMKYAVLTTKHHDGYALWPSKYGKFNTKNGANGRDLVGEFVDAARRHGLKVGFYYSPRDWSYNDSKGAFSVPMQRFDRENPMEFQFPENQNKEEYLKWIDFTVGQLSELMTNYGKIDLMWFDGSYWQGDVPNSEYGNKVRNWLYKMQPQIVINPRWGTIINPDYELDKPESMKKLLNSTGDFYTFESKWNHITHPKHNAGVYEPIWFEFCDIWKGNTWGHSPTESNNPDIDRMHRILERFSTLCALGGNYLLNVGPDGQGRLRNDITEEAILLSTWIQSHKAAFFDAQHVKNWEQISPVPLTISDKTIYVHLTGKVNSVLREFRIQSKLKPVAVSLLSKPNVSVSFFSDDEAINIQLPKGQYNPLGEIVAIQYDENPL